MISKSERAERRKYCEESIARYTGTFAEGSLKQDRRELAMLDAMDEMEAENSTLKGTLLDAITDIRSWLQLARKQRNELPNVDYLPSGPTTHGIETSEALIERIGELFKATQ